MTTLYEIQSALLPLIKRLEETECPLEYELLMGEIDKLDLDRSAKLAGCCAYVKQLQAEGEMIATEMMRVRDRMQTLLDRNKKRRQSFLDYMKMHLTVGEKFQRGAHSISWSCPKSVIVDESVDWRDIGDDAFTYGTLDDEPTWSPDRVKIRQAIESGKSFSWAQLVTKNNLVIK